jgi:hypothetical protein
MKAVILGKPLGPDCQRMTLKIKVVKAARIKTTPNQQGRETPLGALGFRHVFGQSDGDPVVVGHKAFLRG